VTLYNLHLGDSRFVSRPGHRLLSFSVTFLSPSQTNVVIQFSRYSDGLRAGRPGFDSRQGQDLSLLHSVQTGPEAHPASYPMGTGGSFPGVKQQGREADHSPPCNAEVENGEAIPPLPNTSSWPGASHLCCLSYAKLAYSRSLSNSSSPSHPTVRRCGLRYPRKEREGLIGIGRAGVIFYC
jgi:hypothetical protein